MTDEPEVLTKVIKVGGRKLTVHRAKPLRMQIRRFELVEAAQQDPPVEGDGIAASLRNRFHIYAYPSLVACTEGKLFTEEECLDLNDLDIWLQAAHELNPDWFPQVQVTEKQKETEEQEEKKDSQPS